MSRPSTAARPAPAAQTPGRPSEVARERNLLKKLGKLIGPGVITGAADDDPSGIATYAVAGAVYGLASLWTVLYMHPFMVAVQVISARIGLVKKTGLAGVIRDHFPRYVVLPVIALVAIADTINVGADLGAIADAVRVVTGVSAVWLVVPVALMILAVQILGSYALIARVFKWLTLALFAYVIDAVIVHPDVRETLLATVVPTFSFDPGYLKMLVALVGTTISPYLFFWQSSEEAEEERKAEPRRAVLRWTRRRLLRTQVRYATLDTHIGMFWSNVVMYFIILATALTLFRTGHHDIRTGADAADALKPLAGDAAGILFAVGMIGAGVLGIPVLSGAAAYAVSEALGWHATLDAPWHKAKLFYAVVAVSTLLGTLLNFAGINPIDALVWTAVLMGVVNVPVLVLLMLIGRDRRIMGDQRLGPVLSVLGWAITLLMTLNVVALLVTSITAP